MRTRAPGSSPIAAALALVLAAGLHGQEKPPVPRPFPKPSQPAAGQPAAQKPTPTLPAAPGAPTEATLGVPIYPGAEFLASYDAGQGQRYYVFGSPAVFLDVVAYYKSVLKQKGELVFEEPPTQMFEVGRYREDTMAFPPGVTVKDFTWGGMRGYANPRRDARPAFFPTLIQIVPVPPGGKQP